MTGGIIESLALVAAGIGGAGAVNGVTVATVIGFDPRESILRLILLWVEAIAGNSSVSKVSTKSELIGRDFSCFDLFFS